MKEMEEGQESEGKREMIKRGRESKKKKVQLNNEPPPNKRGIAAAESLFIFYLSSFLKTFALVGKK